MKVREERGRGRGRDGRKRGRKELGEVGEIGGRWARGWMRKKIWKGDTNLAPPFLSSHLSLTSTEAPNFLFPLEGNLLPAGLPVFLTHFNLSVLAPPKSISPIFTVGQ